MKKQKRWQFILIAVVMLLTVYNILPTVLFYSRPLKDPINEKSAGQIAKNAVSRVNSLEDESLKWLKSYNKLLGVTPTSITLDPEDPQLIFLKYKKAEDAQKFKTYLPRAGALIPFVPAQLSLIPSEKELEESVVAIHRNIPIHFNTNKIEDYFRFTEKRDAQGKITPLFHEIITDRLSQVGLAVGGDSENAQYVDAILHRQGNPRSEEFLQVLTQNILTYSKVFGESSPIAKRYYATLTQGASNKKETVKAFIATLEKHRDQVKLKRISLQEDEQREREKGGFLETNQKQQLDFLKTKEERFTSALGILRRQESAFTSGATPFTKETLRKETSLLPKEGETTQTLAVGGRSPLIKAVVLNWNNETIELELHKDILNYKKEVSRSKPYLADSIDQLIYHEVARIARESRETLNPKGNAFAIELNQLTESESLLVMDLSAVAKKECEQLARLIKTQWNPTHPDLKRSAFPIYDYETFKTLPAREQKMGLIIAAPATLQNNSPAGFRSNSIYVIAKGIQEVLTKLDGNLDSPQAQHFIQDFNQLRLLLQRSGFNGYSGATYPLNGSFSKDFIFEAEDFYNMVLTATRENFTTHGTGKYALLEFSNVEQRVLALNRIETKQHEDLLRWRDEYQAAQVRLEPHARYDIPAPTKSPFLSNLMLSMQKYFRGDDRKILHWGLDLSGGKTVQIQLRDSNNKVVTNDADLKQGIDELYNRVNKMGVSEVAIRQEGSNITLDFPSAQGLSAADLVKASSMYFHIVNEKFSENNRDLAPVVQQFLQDIWNEAVVTNRKDMESINQIAWKHLYGDAAESDMAQPISESAKILYSQGLRLASPKEGGTSSQFNDAISKLALYRGESYTDWNGQTHPLLIVMNNYALEGANLTNVHAAYEPTKGNYLAFNVKGTQTLSDGQKINPREDLYHWTAPFSKEKIQGTSLDKFSKGAGWRMAVILNGSIINTATVTSPLRDSVSISGSFTQREASRLEADLKAGSLTFAPHILSEKNVSPELGLKDRTMGIIATGLALLFVILIMVGYYRFAGVVASVAVIANLLIIWATLQNISATITLAGIAGIILTVGMAVDANVLVFERIREEFALSGRIASAVHAGYKKAFSAIIDSNITTIIAAVILLQFDSGPIKGFAVTLIIGIASSMFTALFLTRYFFSTWVQNPKNTALKMANLIKKTHFNFLKYGKASIYSTLAVVLVGGYLLVSEKSTLLGMDFTGGYSATLELKSQGDENYTGAVEKALISAGMTAQDFQVRSLSPSNYVKVLFARSLDQSGRPFHNMPLETNIKDTSYPYENNPRLVYVVDALAKEGLSLTPQGMKGLESSWTSVSGQISNAMRNNAILGLSIALMCILAYITFRFEFKYAISATLGLAIDVAVTVAIITILHGLGVPVQIDLNTIAALMTIIGYSLNDTIIIFDRIREDLKRMKKHSFKEVVNHALNVTLSRTIMTSGTTLAVLLSLLFLGGQAIFGLSLVMVIGVVFGTVSSLFIAAPLLLFFDKKEKVKAEKLALREN